MVVSAHYKSLLLLLLLFTHFQKAKLAILPCMCTVYCTTSIAYTVCIHASESEVNICLSNS